MTLDLPAPPTKQFPTVDYSPATGMPVMAMPDIQRGFQLPGYRIEEELGRGAMGVVCKAVRESDGAGVALKTIMPSVGVTRKQVERFVRECRILAELSHPHIVGFHGVEEA